MAESSAAPETSNKREREDRKGGEPPPNKKSRPLTFFDQWTKKSAAPLHASWQGIDLSPPGFDNARFRVRKPLAWGDLHRYEWVKRVVEAHPDRAIVYALPRECILVYIPRLQGEGEGRAIAADLDALDMRETLIYDRPTPRAIAWLVDVDDPSLADEHYRFSGQEQKTQPMPPSVKKLMLDLKSLTGLNLNSVLVNKYRKEKIYNERGEWVRGAGKESIAAHRDKEGLFGDKLNIVMISIGQRRKFVVRYMEAEKVKYKLQFSLGGGDLFVMGENTNLYSTHEVPKEPELNPTQHRYSLTFRVVVSAKGRNPPDEATRLNQETR